jgi:hypothetical protein
MSNEAQDVTVETPTAEAADNDVKVEAVETEVEETEVKTSPETEGDITEAEEPQETVEAKLERLERENAGKQKAIDRKTAAYHSAQRALDERNRQIEELKAISKPEEQQEPVIDDFETHDEYVNAVADFRAEQRVQAKEQELLQAQKQEAINKVANERAAIANKQKAEYLATNPRYEASEGEFNSFITTAEVKPEVENAIVEAAFEGNVPAVIDYFGANNGENMDELAEIVRMSPIKAGIEIYKIQQKLGKPQAKEKQPLPKPVKSPKGKSTGNKSLDDASGSDILKWVNG